MTSYHFPERWLIDRRIAASDYPEYEALYTNVMEYVHALESKLDELTKPPKQYWYD